jgi:two-component system response regulator GlrR
VAKSPVTRALLARLHEASRTSQPVLLTGETGTGKEVAARLIHTWSRRAKSTFVPINCAAIPNELMEGELFGYVKGAFSGAVREYEGLVAAAEGGTVFLDEIDDTPHSLQVKLLRVLEDRVVSRLGESSWRRVDFRVLAATNRDLQKLIAEGTFGEDLFERLATVRIALPPLRERLEDLPALVEQLIARYYQEETSPPRARVAQVLPEVLEVLRGWSWPGNIRELRNVIYGALVAKRAGDTLLVSDLPAHLLRGEPTVRPGSGQLIDAAELDRRIAAGTMNLKAAREELERLALTSALRRANGNASAAARLLGAVGRGGAQVPGDTVRVMARRLKVKVPRRGEG